MGLIQGWPLCFPDQQTLPDGHSEGGPNALATQGWLQTPGALHSLGKSQAAKLGGGVLPTVWWNNGVVTIKYLCRALEVN